MSASRGLPSWDRRRREATANKPVPRVHRCTAGRRRDGRYDIVIRGTDLSTGTVPIVAHLGEQRVAELEAVSSSELRGVIDACRPGDRIDLDLGPLGTVSGTVSDVTRSVGGPIGRLERLLARLRSFRQALRTRFRDR
ncbi:MAG: hypothetical protein OEV40_10425 [Acidimicrobiia bacterium]|nr:hypothetical protein [Acidimicrobiia bacterium]